MRVLWIGRYADREGGEYVYDRKAIDAIRRRGHEVEVVEPVAGPRWLELARMVTHQLPHYRGRYITADNLSRIAAAAQRADVAICSWEPHDALALDLPVPTVLALHNITSRSLPAIFPGNRLAGFLAARARAYEHRAYRTPGLAGIATLSLRDKAYIDSLGIAARSVWTPPGMPPDVPLDAAARLEPALVLSGSYDWKAKRRDVIRFAEEFAAWTGRPTFASDDTLPPEVAALLPVQPARLRERDEVARRIRFGVVPDRFEAGHKLKTLYYIASNCIVLSFADVSFDFERVPDHAFFIRRVETMADVQAVMAEVGSLTPADLVARFTAFKRRCVELYSWDAVARDLLAAFEPMARRTATESGRPAAVMGVASS